MGGKIETLSQLYAFVTEKETHIDWRVLDNPNVTSVGCGDPLLDHHASWLIVGGGAHLMLKAKLRSWYAAREGQSGIIDMHFACGWLYKEGYTTYESQGGVYAALRNQVELLNRQHHAAFVVPEPVDIGSAALFMSGKP